MPAKLVDVEFSKKFFNARSPVPLCKVTVDYTMLFSCFTHTKKMHLMGKKNASAFGTSVMQKLRRQFSPIIIRSSFLLLKGIETLHVLI